MSRQNSPTVQRIGARIRSKLSLSGCFQWNNPEIMLLATALLVGITTGLLAILFRMVIDVITGVSFYYLPEAVGWRRGLYLVLAPAAGGLVVGLGIHHLARETKGSGIPDVMEAVATRGGRIRFLVAPVKLMVASITIGTGGSAGREGPIVQIGATVGSYIGQKLHLSSDRLNNLVACGAAAGIAATFNAPIAGVMFALEVILGRFGVRYFSSVVVAAVSASVIGRAAFGDTPAFHLRVEYGVYSLWEFLVYPLLGVVAALVGVAFVRLLYATKDLADAAIGWPEWIKPAIGGLLLGVLALAIAYSTDSLADFPSIYGVGYQLIDSALANELVLGTALILMVAKLVATCLTVGSGGSGGVFAPSLFVGAMMGAAFELVLDRLFPGISGPPGAYALVGMAALVAATAHAPITSVIMIFELTGDYRIILPLMLTVVVATSLAQQLLQGESIYTLKLTRRGVRLQHGRDVDILQSVTVDEVMTKTLEKVKQQVSVLDLADIFVTSHNHGLLVVDDEDRPVGIVTLSDLERGLSSGRSPDLTAADIATTWPNITTVFPDETMGDALARMGARGLGRLPVVTRTDPPKLIGLIWREAITDAYNLALARRAEIVQRTEQAQQQFEEEIEFIDITVAKTDHIVGKSVADIAPLLPRDSVLVSIRRQKRVIIPHGDTEFQPGDVLTAFVHHADAGKLLQSLRGGQSD